MNGKITKCVRKVWEDVRGFLLGSHTVMKEGEEYKPSNRHTNNMTTTRYSSEAQKHLRIGDGEEEGIEIIQKKSRITWGDNEEKSSSDLELSRIGEHSEII